MEQIAYRINDFAKVLGVSRASLYRLMSRGELQTSLVCGRRVVKASEAERLLSDGAQR